MNKSRLAVVLEDCLVSGGGDIRGIGDTILGARSFLAEAVLLFEVIIISPRFTEPGEMKAAKGWMQRTMGDITNEVKFKKGFPAADIYISPRAVNFNGEFMDPRMLMYFRSWRGDRS